MNLDVIHPLNQGVLAYLGRGEKSRNAVVTAPGSVADPYMGQGSHPDIVARLWDELGAKLPQDCRCLVYGTPALVHPESGIVLGIANGTQYNLRLTPDGFQTALLRGATTRTRWSNGEEMEATTVLGPDWIFGGWFKEEALWCLQAYVAEKARRP